MSAISPRKILNQLRQYLPQVNSKFQDQSTGTGEILAGDPQTLRVTLAAHGLTVGKTILISDALINNGITAVSAFTENGQDYLRFTTNENHDLSLNDFSHL